MRGKRGFSLLEILLAVSILLTCFLFLMGVFPASFQGIAKARNLSFANQLAQQNLEGFVRWYSAAGTTGFKGGGGIPCVGQRVPSPPCSGSGRTVVTATVNNHPVTIPLDWQVVGNYDTCSGIGPAALPCTTGAPCAGPACQVVHVISWVRWLEYGTSAHIYMSGGASPPGGLPGGGFGAHIMSAETWVYLP